MPVTEPSLGLLISNGFRYLLSGQYWISFYPGVALLITIVSINLVGRRADIAALRSRVEAAAEQIKVARASFYPSVNLTALSGLQSEKASVP